MLVYVLPEIYVEERLAGVYNPYNELIFFSDPYWTTQFSYLSTDMLVAALLGLEKYNAEIKSNPYTGDYVYLNKIALELISVYKSSIAELYIGTFNGMLTTMSYTATGFEQLQFTNMSIQQDMRHQFAYYDSVTGNRAPATDMDAEAALMTGGSSAKGTGRTFTSPDKYVGETANAIEAEYPGKVVDVNKIVKDSTGRIITDYDIELDNYIIQVKSGTAKGLTTQIQNTAASNGKTVIGYTPDLNPSSAVVKGVQNAGYNIFTTLKDLLNFLGR